MNVLLLSDIHSNLAALEAVVRHAKMRFDIGETWVMGDLVGYGPFPNECLALFDSMGVFAVAGNHDLAVIESIGTENFNGAAAAAVTWTQNEVDSASLKYLQALPVRMERHGVSLVHGSPRHPAWEYVYEELGAAEALDDVDTVGLAVGHAHVPAIFVQRAGVTQRVPVRLSKAHSIGAGVKYLVNPGSVGQPRDDDPRASYAVLELVGGEVLISHHRVEYDYESTAAAILRVGLPSFLAERLGVGR